MKFESVKTNECTNNDKLELKKEGKLNAIKMKNACVNVQIKHLIIKALIDTGAFVSVCSDNFVKALQIHKSKYIATNMVLHTANLHPVIFKNKIE